MWQLKSISAYNFMSFEKVQYDFSTKCYIVKANNLDNDGQQSNGGGKTSFVDIISIALLGYSLTGRNTKDCINWNSDKDYFEVEVILSNYTEQHDMHSADPTICQIKRKIYTKKSGELVILHNDGQLPLSLPTKAGVVNGVDVKEGNKYILDQILNIKEDDLLNYFLISKSHYNPFLEVNTDKKLEVISRFTNTTVIDKALRKIEFEIGYCKDGIDEYNNTINQVQGYIQALEDSLKTNLEKEFIEKKDNDIAAIELKRQEIENELLNLDQEITTLLENKDKQESSTIKIDSDNKKSIQLSCEKYLANIGQYKELRDQLSGDISLIQNFLAGLITCPACAHQFHLREDGEFTQQDLSSLLSELEKVNDYLFDETTALEQAEESLQRITTDQNTNNSIQLEINIITRKIKSIENQQERLLKEFDRLQLDLETVSAKTFDDQRYNIRQNIRDKETEITTLTQQRTQLEQDLDKNNKWITHFEDFKFYLGNRPLELICSLVNQYLKLSGSDLNLQIEGFKKLKSGQLRQALNPVIYRNWLDPREYNTFSEGEKTRLNLAVDMAFQQLINSCCPSGGLNLYINDELLSNLDSIGVLNAANAYNNLDKTILLVTHSGSDLVYDNIIQIQKKNNISSII